MNVLLISPLPPPAGGIASWTKNYMESKRASFDRIFLVNTAVTGGRVRDHSRRNLWNEWKRARAILQELKKQLDLSPIDIVHLSCPCGKFGLVRDYLCAFLVKRRGVGLVTQFHCHVPHKIRSKSSLFFLKRLVRVSNEVLTLDEGSERFIEDHCKRGSIRVPNFIPDEYTDFVSDKKETGGEIRTVIFAGHVTEKKGCRLIYEIADRFPEIRFLLLGHISDPFQKIERPANVELRGELSPEQLRAEMREGDLFLFPTQTEGFPLAVIEAMAAGMPVISTRAGAIPEIVGEDGGILIPFDDSGEAAKAISSLGSKALREKMASRNRERVRTCYTAQTVISKLFEIYRDVLARDRKRVILFLPTLITGGAEKFVTDLAALLDKEVFDVSVAVVSGILPEGYEGNRFCDTLTEQGVLVFDLMGGNKLITARNIWSLIRQERPDVVHANLGSLLYVMLFAAAGAVKTRIFTFHNLPALTASGFRKPLYRFAFKALRFQPVAVCDRVKKAVSEEFHIPPEKIPCVYNGVDTKAFSPDAGSHEEDQEPSHQNGPAALPGSVQTASCESMRPAPHDQGAVTFISAGALSSVKNHRLLIDAFAGAEALHPDIRLTLLGQGELRGPLLKQIAGYGLEDKIDLPGTTEKVAEALRQADVYVMSSDSEGLPLSVLEAMACGLPVISTAAGGVLDVVGDGENGFITPVGDAKSLSHAMIRLIEQGDLRRAMGKASREKALKLDLHECVACYQKLYLGGRSCRHNEQM